MMLEYLVLVLAATTPALAQGDLAALLQSQPDLSQLLTAVSGIEGLNDTLSTTPNITIFAPTDSAFEALLQAGGPEADALSNNQSDYIEALLQRHVVRGQFPASSITSVPSFVNSLLTPNFLRIGTGIGAGPLSNVTDGLYTGVVLNGEDVDVISNPTTVSRVTQADIRLGDNVIIHKVDNVLRFAPTASQFAANSNLTTFNSAVGAANLTDRGISDVTVFIPNNDAFTRIGSVIDSANASTLAAVLYYHGVQGVAFSPSLGNVTLPSVSGGELEVTVFPDGKIFVNGAQIIYANAIVEAGAAHIIDNVLNPLEPPPARDSIDPNADAGSRVQFSGASSAPITIPSATVPPQTVSTPSILITATPIASATATGNNAGPVNGGATTTSTPTGGAARPVMMAGPVAGFVGFVAFLLAA